MPDGRIIIPDIRDAERLQGFPANWTKAAKYERGVRKKGARWKLVGNAVSVPVAKWVGKCLAKPRNPVPAESRLVKPGQKWPTAAWGTRGEAYSYDVSSWPKSYKRVGLAEFLKHPGTPLSLRAATGFRARTKRSSLRFRPEFLKAVDEHIRSLGGFPETITAETGRRRQKSAATASPEVRA